MAKKIIVGIKNTGFVMLVPRKMYAVSPGITPRSVPSMYQRNDILVTPNPKLTKSNGNRGTIRKNNTVINGDSLIDPSNFFRSEKFKILKKLDGSISESPFITVLFLRMVPLFPFDFVNFGLGVTKISFRWYILGTLLGVIPGLTAYIFLGTSITNPVFLIPTIIFFAILIGTSWYIKKRSSLAKKLKKELEENK